MQKGQRMSEAMVSATTEPLKAERGWIVEMRVYQAAIHSRCILCRYYMQLHFWGSVHHALA